MEYLTKITTTIPEGTEQEEVDRRRAAEAEYAREMAAAGHLVRLWRPVGETWSVGLWRAADDAGVKEVLDSLPLRSWMSIEVTPLTPHPNDPGA
jgi:muconolactone D-isomerase